MFIPYQEISEHANTWIFVANRQLNSEELDLADNLLLDFTNHWQSHGRNVYASFQITENSIIALFADEALVDVSGCSKDSMTQCIKKIEQTLNIELLNRTLIPVKGANFYKIVHFNDLKSIADIESKFIFNPTINNKNDFKNTLFQKFEESRFSSLVV
jgi:hypothetical protein